MPASFGPRPPCRGPRRPPCFAEFPSCGRRVDDSVSSTARAAVSCDWRAKILPTRRACNHSQWGHCPRLRMGAFASTAARYRRQHRRRALLLGVRAFSQPVSFIDGHLPHSLRTVPQLASRVHAGDEPPCDVILIDGSHKTPDVKKDLHAFRGAARCHAPIFMDDLEAGPGNAVDEAERDGLLRMRQWFVYDSRQGPAKGQPDGGPARRNDVPARPATRLQPLHSMVCAHAGGQLPVPPAVGREEVRLLPAGLPVGHRPVRGATTARPL